MTPGEVTTIITSILQSSGFLVFLIFMFRSFRREIASLRRTIDDQSKTLEVMERRIIETEKIGLIYRDLVRELPEDIEKYKALTAKLKNEMIQELELANQRKDEELARITEQRLIEIETQERIILELPKLRDELVTVVLSIQDRLGRITDRPTLIASSSSDGIDLEEVFARWTDYMDDRGLVLKKKKKGSSCFITSACIEAKGRPDDCVELTALRWWRDTYLKRLPNGELIISDYYAVAPAIISAINESSDKGEIYEGLYQTLVLKTVTLIASGEKKEAFNNYWGIVCNLKQKYLPQAVTGV